MKKILASLLSVAMIFAVCFSFAGCGTEEVAEAKVYQRTDMTVTYVTSTNDNGTVADTETLSFNDYCLKVYKMRNSIEPDAVLTEEQQTAFDAYLVEKYEDGVLSETVKKEIILQGENMSINDVEYDLVTGQVSKSGISGTFYASDGMLTFDGVLETSGVLYNCNLAGTFVDNVITIKTVENNLPNANSVTVYYVTEIFTLVV